jgi:hypothetical protein
MSGGVLDIRHHFGCCIRCFLITLLLSIIWTFIFLLCTKYVPEINDTTLFRANKIHLFSVGLLGFVGFIVNLLNRLIAGATVHALKSASEKELLVRMGVRKITFFINIFFYFSFISVEYSTILLFRILCNMLH